MGRQNFVEELYREDSEGVLKITFQMNLRDISCEVVKWLYVALY
jgi:hypothetical protein